MSAQRSPADLAATGALAGFSEPTAAWFRAAFAEPTSAQAGAWDTIGKGEHALVIAPTGSGKTLAAFLWAIDKLATDPTPADAAQRCRVLYISPLKALAVDIERNLRSPLAGVSQARRRLGLPEPEIRVGVRTGDTAADERRQLASKPPDILITTPESLFLLLTSRARDGLRSVQTVIIDEVHALAGGKRGAHLALSLERLDALRGDKPAQRIGLSATVRPPEEVASFLGGSLPVRIVAPASQKRLDLRIVVPVEDMSDLEGVRTPGNGGGADPAVRRPFRGRRPGRSRESRRGRGQAVRQRRPATELDLAARRSPGTRRDRAASVHDRVRQLQAARRTALRPPQRTSRRTGGRTTEPSPEPSQGPSPASPPTRRSSPAPTTARYPAPSGARSRKRSRPDSCPPSSPPPASS